MKVKKKVTYSTWVGRKNLQLINLNRFENLMQTLVLKLQVCRDLFNKYDIIIFSGNFYNYILFLFNMMVCH